MDSVGVSNVLHRNHEVEVKSSVQMKRKRRLCGSVNWRDLVIDKYVLGEMIVWV